MIGRSHFIFQAVLMSITLIAGIIIIIDKDYILMGAVWLFILGVLQVLHSFILGVMYRKEKRLIEFLLVYWFLSFTDLLLLFFVTQNQLGDFLFYVLIPAVPLGLAIYFWATTYIFYKIKLPPVLTDQQ